MMKSDSRADSIAAIVASSESGTMPIMRGTASLSRVSAASEYEFEFTTFPADRG